MIVRLQARCHLVARPKRLSLRFGLILVSMKLHTLETDDYCLVLDLKCVYLDFEIDIRVSFSILNLRLKFGVIFNNYILYLLRIWWAKIDD